jgi:hypothetical protein
MDIGLTMEVCVVEIDAKTTEPLHVSSVGGGEYFVESIPFVTDKVSRCDLISVDVRGDTLYFAERLSQSGHRTISVVSEDPTAVEELGKIAETHNLLVEQNDRFNLLAIDLPVKFDPAPLVTFLDQATQEKRLAYTLR